MEVRDITVQFSDYTYIRDAIGFVLFNCFISTWFVRWKKNCTGLEYITHKENLFYIYVAETWPKEITGETQA
jgi:hypothetical protein